MDRFDLHGKIAIVTGGSRGIGKAIAPAYIATDLTEGVRASEKISQNLLQRTPMGRFGETEEIVTAALYFASEYSSYTTGTVLTVDGGWMAY